MFLSFVPFLLVFFVAAALHFQRLALPTGTRPSLLRCVLPLEAQMQSRLHLPFLSFESSAHVPINFIRNCARLSMPLPLCELASCACSVQHHDEEGKRGRERHSEGDADRRFAFRAKLQSRPCRSLEKPVFSAPALLVITTVPLWQPSRAEHSKQDLRFSLVSIILASLFSSPSQATPPPRPLPSDPSLDHSPPSPFLTSQHTGSTPPSRHYTLDIILRPDRPPLFTFFT